MSEVVINHDARGIATVTLNRPDKHNAFDDKIIAQLTEAFKQIDSDDSIRVMILSGAGKSFSAGGDLSWMKRMTSYSYQENLADAKALAVMLNTLNTLSKPTVARVHGAAYGGAVGLVSCCDIAIGTERASFSLSEVKVGLLPATISPYVIAAIGERAARRYFLSAERFNAKTALTLGLLSEIVEEQELDQTIDHLVEILLSNSPNAIAASKQLISDVLNQPINEKLMDETSARIAAIRISPEGQEGLSAFLEKRTPSWQNTDKDDS